jgi:mono/diheme cytochrome c family protein
MKRTITLAVVLALFVVPTLVAEDAAALFKTKCQACHGVNGAADTPMSKKLGVKAFSSADVQGQTDAQLTATIKNGKAPKMPSFNGKLTDDQIKAIVGLIRSFKK